MTRRASPYRLTPEDSAITDGYANGLSVAVIAQSIGVKPKRVMYRAQALGIKHRSRTSSLEERFWQFVNPEPNTGCFLWSGALNGSGRANIAAGGRQGSRLASHVAMELAGRPVPPGLFALHHCDNPACVNPDHIFFGGQDENVKDCRAKGRLSATPEHRRRRRIEATECLRGHPLEGSNLIFIKTTGRALCRLCRNENSRNLRRRRAEMRI